MGEPNSNGDGGAAALPDSVTDSFDADLEPGRVVGEYEIAGKLGEGGFGTVFSAHHPLIGKKAAVKVLSREFSAKPEMVSRFIAEARAVNTIRHDNIVDIFNFGTLDDGRHYFVMELLDGLPLDKYLEQHGALSPPLVIEIMRGVARAVDAAHAKGIVHRDLKPDNILVTFNEDGRPVPKLLDFGVAKLLGDATTISGHKTRTGVPVGTPHYMSPEQCLGIDVDERVDVYAFGVVCFEALTGQMPFAADSFLELMNKQAHAERPSMSSVNPELGDSFDEAIKTMMSRDRDERPETLTEALAMLIEAAKEAGHNVDAPATVPSPTRTGVNRGEQETADTVMDPVSAATARPETRSTASSTIAGEHGGSKMSWLIVAAVVVVGVGVYIASGALTRESAAPVAPSTPSSATTVAASPSPSPEPSSTAAPTATASASATPSTLTIRIECAAPGAVAYLMDGQQQKKLGPLPGSFDLLAKEGDERSLVVKAAHHQTKKFTTKLSESEPVKVVLVRISKRLNKDLEDPFSQ